MDDQDSLLLPRRRVPARVEQGGLHSRRRRWVVRHRPLRLEVRHLGGVVPENVLIIW